MVLYMFGNWCCSIVPVRKAWVWNWVSEIVGTFQTLFFSLLDDLSTTYDSWILSLSFLLNSMRRPRVKLLNSKLKFRFELYPPTKYNFWIQNSRYITGHAYALTAYPACFTVLVFEDGGWFISYLQTISTRESSVDSTLTDRIVLRLNYIKRCLVNIRDTAETDTVLTQPRQVTNSPLDERH